MDTQNHFYGHSATLAVAAGQSRVRHLPGLLQHGWAASSPIASMFHDFPAVGTGDSSRKLLVWSHDSRAWNPRDFTHRTTPIGAPFLYLLRLRAADTTVPPSQRRPLIAPQHTTLLRGAPGGYDELARYYRDKYGPSTVCLHGDDLRNPTTVAAWRSADHDVVTAGDRFDPNGLNRQLTGLSAASHLVTNRLSTIVFYALTVGIPITIDGEATLLDGDTATTVDFLRRQWPELHHDASLADQQQLARSELGVQHLMDQAELAATLGWDRIGPGAAAGFDYWAVSPVRKAGMVLGLRQRTEFEEQARAHGTDNVRPQSKLAFLKHPRSHLPSRLPQLPNFAQPAPWLRPDDI